jgi:hypothetical protein
MLEAIVFNFAFALTALEDRFKGEVEDWHCSLLLAISIILAYANHVVFQVGVLPLLAVVFILCCKEYMGWADFFVFASIAIAFPELLALIMTLSVITAEVHRRWKKEQRVKFIPYIFLVWCVITTIVYELPLIYQLASSIIK